MSWSISSTGKAAAVAAQIATQVASIKLTDAGEMQTVGHVGALLAQSLGTFDPERLVSVSANGLMSFADWATKVGPYQQFNIKVEPIHLTT